MAAKKRASSKKGGSTDRNKAAISRGPGETANDDGRQVLDMAQAVEMLKTTRPTFYRWLRAGKIKGMKVGRQWRFYREDIERFLSGQGPRIDLPADIDPPLEALAERIGGLAPDAPLDESEEEPIRAVRRMLQVAALSGASDLHVAVDSGGGHVRQRIDGVLHPVLTYDARLHPAIVTAFKTLGSCDIHETELPQDGRVVCELPGVDGERDIRLNFVPARGGEAVTARLLCREGLTVSIERLKLPPEQEATLLRHIEAPSGLIFVTGPTGSGKTTTLYACLAHLNRPEVKVVTVEDPIELSLDGVVQVQVRPHQNRTFAAVCRALMRTDPDAILVGEIRDRDTAAICAQMSLTGHLVLTTLHTNSAAESLVRMVEIGVEPFVLANATRLVAAQRLVRMLCPECSRTARPDRGELQSAAELARAGGLDLAAASPEWREAVGCAVCRQTGYRGRRGVLELLEVTPEIGRAVRRGADAGELQTIAVGQGMTTLAAGGLALAARGETSLTEALRVMARR